MYKDTILNKKAVLFDLDGTIIDSKGLWVEAIKKTAATYDLSPLAIEMYYNFGASLEGEWNKIIVANFKTAKVSLGELAKKTEEAFQDIVENKDTQITIRKGFWSLVKELKLERNFKLGLVTNTTKETVDIILKKLGMEEIFDVVVCGDEVHKAKPSPEGYLTAAKKLGCIPKDVTVFEDSVTGSQASANAGMDTIIIWDQKTPQSRFEGNILNIFLDFSPLPGNMEYTYQELAMERFKNYFDEKGNPIPKTQK